MTILIKKIFMLAIGILISSLAFGQSFDVDLKATMLKNYDIWKKGEEVNIKKISFDQSTTVTDISSSTEQSQKVYYGMATTVTYDQGYYLYDDNNNKVLLSSKATQAFDFHIENVQQLWDSYIITDVLYSLVKNGFCYDLRHEMENDALDYIQTVKKYNLELDDPYLETYIYSLIAKIAPRYFVDYRPVNINLLIQQNPSINACCYPNGTIVLNTGLLAVLHSEAELVAILAHEIAHFVLDHSVRNVILAEQRQRRAEFWAALATGLTAAAEVYTAATTNYYVSGTATMGVALMASNIADAVINRLGMNYNHEQEKEADHLAIKVLETLGYDKNALSTALSRLKNEYLKDRNNVMYINSYTHPALITRISDAGKPQEVREPAFEQIVSFAVSNVAMMKFSDRRFRQCLSFVCQNIENNVATSDDYILKANCLLYTKNDIESNKEVINLIDKAKEIDNTNLNTYKSEIIAYLRLNDKAKAIELIDQYVINLESFRMDYIKSADYWDEMRKFISSEIRWAKQMKLKLNGIDL